MKQPFIYIRIFLQVFLESNVPRPELEEEYKTLRERKLGKEEHLSNKEMSRTEIGKLDVLIFTIKILRMFLVNKKETY